MKRLSRKLFMSVIAVLFAILALGTSTFAWFTMNDVVKVENLKMTAVAPDSLEISLNGVYTIVEDDLDTTQANQDALTWDYQVAVEISGEDSLKPCYFDSVSSGAVAYYIPSDGNKILRDGTPEVAFATTGSAAEYWEEVNSTGIMSGSTYFHTDDIYVRVNGNSNTTFTVRIDTLEFTIDSDEFNVNKEIYKAARIGFVLNDGNTMYTYKVNEFVVPSDGTDATAQFTASQELTFDLTGVKYGTDGKVTSVADVAKVSIYLWFDGSDAKCINEEAIDSLFNINLAFTTKEN